MQAVVKRYDIDKQTFFAIRHFIIYFFWVFNTFQLNFTKAKI